MLDYEYDTVIHLAASTRVIESIKKPSLMIDNNVIGTFRLLEYCRKRNIKNVVIASTGGAIIGEESGLISELSRPNPISPYGASKLFIEALSNSYCVNYGMEIACLRFSNVYGPKSHRKESVIANFFKRIKNEQEIIIFGDGLQERDYIYVDDISQFTLSLSGFITGYLILWLINTIYKSLKKVDGIGGGDFILLAGIGSLVGPFAIAPIIFFGSLSTIFLVLVTRFKLTKTLPLGSGLIIGLFIYLFLKFYELSLFGLVI